MPTSCLTRPNLRNSLCLLFTTAFFGCGAKRALVGSPTTWLKLPTAEPTATFAETLCPSESAPEKPPTGRLYQMKSGALVDWSGGDSSFFTVYPRNQWHYKANDPDIARWMALVDESPTTGGTAMYFVEDLTGIKMGTLLLVPQDGAAAYRILLSKKSKQKKVNGVYEVLPIPKSAPSGIVYCYTRVEESWPAPTTPATPDIMYYADETTKELYRSGNKDEAIQRWLDQGLPWLWRYADDDLASMLRAWKRATDETAKPLGDTPPIAGATSQADLWAAILQKYDQLVAQGKAPPLPEAAAD